MPQIQSATEIVLTSNLPSVTMLVTQPNAFTEAGGTPHRAVKTVPACHIRRGQLKAMENAIVRVDTDGIRPFFNALLNLAPAAKQPSDLE